MRRLHPILVLLTAATAAPLLTVDRTATLAQTAPASQPSDAAPPGPVSYYTDKCSTCHGPVEHAYQATPLQSSGAALRDAIDQMANGPAMAPLAADGLANQVKLHEAIKANGPYVWLSPGKGPTLTGELIPGTQVILKTPDGESVKAKIDTDALNPIHFTLPRRPGTIVATRNQQTLRIDRTKPED